MTPVFHQSKLPTTGKLYLERGPRLLVFDGFSLLAGVIVGEIIIFLPEFGAFFS
jgi:hypothetical protein